MTSEKNTRKDKWILNQSTDVLTGVDLIDYYLFLYQRYVISHEK